jgi:hypothetical protein
VLLLLLASLSDSIDGFCVREEKEEEENRLMFYLPLGGTPAL